MKPNVGVVDRIVRFILGVILTSWAIAGGPVWAYLGFFFLFPLRLGAIAFVIPLWNFVKARRSG